MALPQPGAGTIARTSAKPAVTKVMLPGMVGNANGD